MSWKSPAKQRKRLAANQSDGNSEADTKVAGFCIRMDLAIKECQTTSTIRDLAGLGVAGAWGGEGLGRRGLVLSWKSPAKQRKRFNKEAKQRKRKRSHQQNKETFEADTKVAGFCIRMDLAIKECQTTSTIRDLADGRLGQHYPRPRRWTLGQHYPRPRRWTLQHYPRPRRWTLTLCFECVLNGEESRAGLSWCAFDFS